MFVRSLKHIALSVLLVLITSVTFAGRIDEINNYVKKIREAQKADHLYSSRYGLDRIFNQQYLTVQEQRELMNAYRILTESFSNWSHYRNAADVYFDYLKLQKNYRNDYLTFLKDSLQKQNVVIESTENNRIQQLDSELKELRKEQGIVAGMKQTYYTFGGIALAVILALFLFLFNARNRAIRKSRVQLEANRKKMLELYRNAAETSMLRGNVSFIRFIGLSGNEKIESLEAAGNTGSEWIELRSLLRKLV